ncbi:hypothetical protein FRX31_030933 [Thalictrum thalictroides]|uniref:Uncharacterized protein n=1 Tax=Thalictrum thalictroides TaxID=46969 RepID=A0A7J6V5G6_THATH|nr:hypothetical protein FRX31_030933 [Thalictrum thalictroides]
MSASNHIFTNQQNTINIFTLLLRSQQQWHRFQPPPVDATQQPLCSLKSSFNEKRRWNFEIFLATQQELFESYFEIEFELVVFTFDRLEIELIDLKK